MGPFRLVDELGKGAMGEVWLAEHRAQNQQVAIKFLMGDNVTDPWAREAFANEVRAVAGLTHPGIVPVLDHGLVDAQTSAASQGRLQVDSPYLVMEVIHGAPLHGWVGRLSWSRLRDTLLQLLDALAHSHARSVIHRDLKPGNVLLRPMHGDMHRPMGRLQALLTDFGLSQAIDRHSAADQVVAGTPAYMAPEQLQGHWRDQGPWTDLYALGCLAWAMATGTPPFGRRRPFGEFVQDHLHTPPPAFEPCSLTPPGFEHWLRRLLMKWPEQRYTCAADAAWGLLGLETNKDGGPIQPDDETGMFVLGGHPHAQRHQVPDPEAPAVTMSLRALEPLSQSMPSGAISSQHLPPEDDDTAPMLNRHSAATEATDVEDDSRALPVSRPPIPSGWSRPAQPGGLHQMSGVGLNLYGLRQIPMVGRSTERGRLWEALHRVDHSGRPEAVVLRGPAGTGKSRLAEWVCRRAQEIGAGTVLSATNDREQGPASGLGPMLARYLRCTNMDQGPLMERLQMVMPRLGPTRPDEIQALAQVVHPDGGDRAGAQAIRFAEPEERLHLIRRMLERIARTPSARGRPILIWLDDVHWSREALAFTRMMLQRREYQPLPVLLLLTVQEEALPDRRAEAGLLDAINQLDGAQTLSLGPLSEDDHRRLVTELLGIEGPLAERVARRTGGNPLFAVQLIGDWVTRGMLEPSEQGFRLRAGAQVDLPEDLHAVWRDRVERLLKGEPSEAVFGLELAATLGVDVRMHEWRLACKRAGFAMSEPLLGRFLAQRLIRREGSADFTFAHGMVRETLMRRSHAGRRRRRMHAACAAILIEIYGERRQMAERLGRHLLLSGSVSKAMSVLLEGAREHVRSGDHSTARRLLVARQRTLKRLRLPTEDPLWGKGWVVLAQVDLVEGDLDEAWKWADRAHRAAQRHGWRHELVEAMLVQGRLHRQEGRNEEARSVLIEAVQRASAQQDEDGIARCELALGTVLISLGQLAEAGRRLRSARGRFQRLGDRAGEADVAWHLGRVALQRGQLDEVAKVIDVALDGFQRAGLRANAAACINGKGELARLRGNLREAEEHYRDAMERMEALDTRSAALPKANLGIVLLERGQFSQSKPLLTEALHTLQWAQHRNLVGALHTCLLVCAAAAAQWEEWDHHMAEAADLLAATRYVDRDVGRMATKAAELARAAQEPARARAAYAIALQQFESLRSRDDAQAIRTAIASLRAPGTP